MSDKEFDNLLFSWIFFIFVAAMVFIFYVAGSIVQEQRQDESCVIAGGTVLFEENDAFCVIGPNKLFMR